MMDAQLEEGALLKQFDQLVEQKLVVFPGAYRTVYVSDGGYQFQFRVLDNFAQKPVAPRGQDKDFSEPQPGCRPGSDISIDGNELASLGTSHILTVNKFPAARPHYLLLTQDGYRRQYEALDLDDLTAASRMLTSLESRHLALFNCGINGGCSRMHKHLHIFPAPDPKTFALWPDAQEPKMPIKFFMRRFENSLPSPDKLLATYQTLLRHAEAALGTATPEGNRAVGHNVILNRSWIVVIPRRAADWDGIDTNAAGMIGMLWVKSEERMRRWMEKGPANVLARLGIPADVVS